MEEFLGGISIYLILCSEEGGDAVNFSENFWRQKKGEMLPVVFLVF